MAVCGATRRAVPEYGITLDLMRQSATTTDGPTQTGCFTLRLLSRLLAIPWFWWSLRTVWKDVNEQLRFEPCCALIFWAVSLSTWMAILPYGAKFAVYGSIFGFDVRFQDAGEIT